MNRRLLFCTLGSLIMLSTASLFAQTERRNPTLTLYTKTTITSDSNSPELIQQTDLSLAIPQTMLFFPLPRLRFYALQRSPLDILNTLDTNMLKNTIGISLYAPQGQYRFMYGALTLKGLEDRLRNPWGKAILLPAAYTRASAELSRTTAQEQKIDLAGGINLKLGQRSILYSLLHSSEPESLHGIMGVEILHIDEHTIRVEAGFGTHMLPESEADTWFASAPLLPERHHVISSISLGWFGPCLQLAGDFARSGTTWEGTGYYYKGAFTFGPPSFRLSGGADMIQGPFRDSAGVLQVDEPTMEKSRIRLELFIRHNKAGTLLMNMETKLSKEEASASYELNKTSGSLHITRGSLFSAWFLLPELVSLEGSCIPNEALPYSGIISATHRFGGTRFWLELKNQISAYFNDTQIQPSYLVQGQEIAHINNTRLKIGTTWEKNDVSPPQAFINITGDYSKDSLRISSSLKYPICNSTDYTASLSLTASW
ncbi:MAG TPA: hypothetical protein PLB48_10410 [Treponema sp.]|jgi:hypothetical protein|nr:hypothetical protein [Treponema sp.]